MFALPSRLDPRMFLRFAALLLAVLVSEPLVAQSLEQDYAKLCSDPAKARSETCQALATSLIAKLQGRQSGATADAPRPDAPRAEAGTDAAWRKRWGVFADMMGKELVSTPGAGATEEVKLAMQKLRSKMEWTVPGQKAVSTMNTGDGVWREVSTVEWDEKTQRLVLVLPPPSNLVSYFVAHPDGSVESPEATYYGITVRGMTRETAPGRYESVVETKKDGAWVETSRTFQASSPEQLAAERLAAQAAPQALPPKAGAPKAGEVAAAATSGKDAGSAAGTHAGSGGGGKPLRFVMTMDMRNLPGDTVNSTCYSNVVTRDGPPGWGAKGFLPPGSGDRARKTVEALKSQFIAACQQSGRAITSEGNFSWVWNQFQGDEERIAGARARFREDVSVSVQ